ncbi:hypothetical protein FGO68_gene2781 [Halteria grandinella]|uniref:Uncharacterized protein n=1 Tax=Halteria grandinella TaxID=5974 RepID=A0A8J8NRG3_HALGN|nr:hypothetical protein FGO68_gene2781 [Halteria grandinella]
MAEPIHKHSLHFDSEVSSNTAATPAYLPLTQHPHSPETPPLQPPPLQQDDHMTPFKRIKFLIRTLSAGKYTTNFYNNAKSEHASVCGGVITVILTTFILVNVYLIFASIFAKNQWNIQQDGVPIIAYQRNSTTVMNKTTDCTRGDKLCEAITIKDFLNQMENMDYRVYFLNQSQTNCSNLRISIFLYELESKGQKNITTMKFVQEAYNALRCKISMKDFSNTDAAKNLTQSELAFMKYDRFSYLNLRLYFVIEGLQPDNYVESNFKLSTILANEGVQEQFRTSMSIRPRSTYTDKLMLVNYENVESIWDLEALLGGPDASQDLKSVQRSEEDAELSSTVPSDSVRIYFQFATSATKYKRYPDSILTGLQKFGGLLGLFKFSILLAYLHKKRFEKKLMLKMRKGVESKPDEIGDTQSVAPALHRGDMINQSHMVTTTQNTNNEDPLLKAKSYEQQLAQQKFEEIFNFENFRHLLIRTQQLEGELREVKAEMQEMRECIMRGKSGGYIREQLGEDRHQIEQLCKQ